MAATRTKAPPVGSAQWIQDEKENCSAFVREEADEFGFSVRNEMEWLNEHMSDIFSRSQVNYADMFRTPGKLRGKTPRTARKVNTMVPRQPLTDIFAPNAQPAPPSATKNSFYEKVAQFQIPQDVVDPAPQQRPVPRGASPNRVGKPYTDSGYHGMMTEDEMEVDVRVLPDSFAVSSQATEVYSVPVREDQAPVQRLRESKDNETGTSDESFVSAKEQKTDAPMASDHEMEEPVRHEEPQLEEEDEVTQDENVAPVGKEQMQVQPVHVEAKAVDADNDQDVDIDMGEGTPQSDASSPEKPLQRKSSFTFSSLPAREPLGAKRSMGQMDRHRSSFSKSINKASQNDADDEMSQEKPAEPRTHSKSSAQLLHERLNMLGKTKEPRSSKSIPHSVLATQPAYPQLPDATQANSQTIEVFEYPVITADQAAVTAEDEDEDWIAPVKPAQQKSHGHDAPGTPSTRPNIQHQKSISTTNIPSPAKPEADLVSRHQKAISVSHPSLVEALGTTTPAGSPMSKKHNDGPLSASKNRLWSALKSAKSIFASSASTSAAAKMEAHNTSPAITRSPRRDSGESKMFNMPGALYSQKELLASPNRNASVISFSPSRKTRSSNESDKRREKELRAQQKAEEELEKAREKERQKAAKQQAEEQAKADKAERAEAAKVAKERKQAEKKQIATERPESADSDKALDNDMPPPPPPKGGLLSTGKLKAPGRLMRPARENAQARPAPVSIRVASQSQRAGQPAAAASVFSKSQGAGSAPQPPPKDGAARPSSAMGNRPGSAAPQNARVKALEAAARKKEADERAAQKKIDQKRELERKRAEKAEQERRTEEERKVAEQQRAQEAKLAAQRKAAEKQAAEARKREQERMEQQRREQERMDQQRREHERVEQQRHEAEQQRREEDARKAKEAHELAEAIRRERAQQAQTYPRGDLPGTLRQLTKNIIPANTVKPAKRQFPIEDEEPIPQPQRPGFIRNPPSYQQADPKRRKTNEEQDDGNARRSVMAPPKRPSTLRKETMSKFSHGYTHAPPPAAHHASMFKATVTSQHQMQHGSKPMHPSQLVQTSSARIPFAENANPPATYQPSHPQMYAGHENAQPNKFKTPARPAHAPKSAKSTPHYPQGDNIELPDIATDSEDESDDDEGGGFRAPSWVASPALRELLTQQQLVDPESVFGPIGELKMDEVFKNSKNPDRLKRFRDRGSSALWIESGDAVTSAEKRKDMEVRERVAREGGWRYEPGN